MEIEHWSEKQIQVMKSGQKFRTTKEPEVLFVNGLMLDHKLGSKLNQRLRDA